MEDQPWLSRVRQRLAKHVLPPNYVERVVEELADHLDDLKEENMEGDATFRLGEPEQVAEAAVAAYRRRGFLGRHPVAAFLVFALSPVVMWCIVFAVSAPFIVNWGDHPWRQSLILVVCSTFVATLYGELAMRLGLGKKWMLASCVVLGVFAMLFENGTVMAPVQFAAALAMGWWLIKWKYSHRYPATAILVVAISPLASHMLLSLIVQLALGITALFVASGSLKFISVLYQPILLLVLMTVLPTALAALFCCWLAGRSGIGRKWTLVPCTVLAVYAVGSFQTFRMVAPDAEGHCLLTVSLMCITLAQCVVPLAIGWWFMRHKRDRDQLQLAS